MKSWLFTLLLLPLTAAAAPRVNNGGGVWVCANGGRTEWIQAADFFELDPERRSRRDFGAASTDEIFKLQQSLVAANFPELQRVLQKWPLDFSKITRYVDFDLSSTGDMNFTSRPQPADCEDGVVSYQQLAVYLYDDTLLIAEPLWRNPKLSPTDQAAILFHEWVYRALRGEQDEQTSARTRRIVAWLFSTADAESARKAIARELLLSSHDQLEDELATFPVNPRCEAFVDGAVVGSWQARKGVYGEKGAFSAEGLRFEVESSAKDGVPGLMQVTHEKTGWSFRLEPAISRASYLRLKRAELRFRIGGKRPAEGVFWCWNQS